MRIVSLALAALSLAGPALLPAQDVPTRDEAQKLYREIGDLMEASAVVVPELARAGAPLTETVRQQVQLLEGDQERDHVGVMYRLLTNAKVYLQLVDALPKPPSFSKAVRGQVEELRLKVDRTDAYFRHVLDQRQEQIRGADRDNLARYSEANATLGPPQKDERRVVFLGDSITDIWEINQFFPGKPYVNRGIGGQVTGQMLGRMRADVLALKPSAMLLLGGTNDLAHGVPVQTIENNIAMIADLADAHGIQVILASVTPVSDYHEDANPRNHRTTRRPPATIIEINDWIKAFAQAEGYVYLDYFSALVDDQGMLRADLADDGLHPNTEGFKIMAPLAEAAIAEALKTKPAAKHEKKRFGIF